MVKTLTDTPLQSRLDALPDAVRTPIIKAWGWLPSDDTNEGASKDKTQHAAALLEILLDLKVDGDTITAAILLQISGDSAEQESGLNHQRLSRNFGAAVARLVTEAGKLKQFTNGQQTSSDAVKSEAQTEALRRMLLAMVEDARVVIIQLAERLLLMQTLNDRPQTERLAIAQETHDIHAPLANRLGIGQIKWQLEDLAFRHLQPKRYQQIAKQLAERRADREEFIEKVIVKLRATLDNAKMNAEVDGRVKHIASIWKKMQRKQLPLSELYDMRAVRIQVETVGECYTALGLIHDLWRPIPSEFDDYIANPKANFYRSLHTAVMTDSGKTLEVQIRTHEMHRHAELGVAAHWRYKEGGHSDPGLDNKINWLRRLLEPAPDTNRNIANEIGGEIGNETVSTSEDKLLEQLRTEALEEHVYVFTPAGQVIELSHGATPLDFAYAVHTGVGHRCRGAKVNNRIVPLTYTLKTGEQIEILKARDAQPSRDWLNPNNGYLSSPSARTKVRHWFNKLDREKNISNGRHTLDRDFKRLGVSDVDLSKLAQDADFEQLDDFLIAVGRGDIGSGTIAEQLKDRLITTKHDSNKAELPSDKGSNKAGNDKPNTSKTNTSVAGLNIHGVGNLLTSLAQCCHPLPPDPIIGFITLGRGVSVHRCDCSNILNMSEEQRARLIEVDWGDEDSEASEVYPVVIEITAVDRHGLLRDVTATLSNEKVNVTGINTRSDTAQHTAHMTLSIDLSDVAQLSRILDKLQQLSNVYEVRRSKG